ncbi:GPI ethanolamine phosphate transferase 3 [Cimex lectularius]|uniref:GPI ethanolamine phosphate transferase 3 n=1 Tax=Cimex lectularius TaxID=79782 RepID=A0A8I6TKC7_CIMLE|nr:GPI ethanolamine phosphate transferase 3 [Cimex lectularius]
MSITFKYVSILVWLCYILISALILFTRGFLLNRNILPDKSSCEKSLFVEDLGKGGFNFNLSTTYCLGNRDLKAIVVLIDALRYDFVKSPGGERDEVGFLPYRNKMKSINEAIDGSKGVLYKFIADPPTTTLQRINALTTGSLPTFIDIGSNFASGEINEDNIIDGALSRNKNVVFMGDDTWVNVYPNRFLRQYAYPSFNVWDLDTVDTGVEEHLGSEINKKDWDLIIAHFLGVDHCGHKYGPNHPEMERKLVQMDNAIRSVMEMMDDKTVLFVIGDHGMTESGDHGGDSELEITSALFVFSKHKHILSRFIELDEIPQIDFVPTFAQLLGIPIPFSNLGTSLLSSSLLTKNSTNNVNSRKNPSVLSIWANVVQVTKYMNQLASVHKTFDDAVMQDLKERYKRVKSQMLGDDNQNFNFETFMKDAREYLEITQTMCRHEWVQFDTFSMTRGLVSMFLTLSLFFITSDGISDIDLVYIIKGNFVWICLMSTLISNLISLPLYYYSFVSNLELTLYFSTCLSCIVVLALVVIINWSSITDKWYKSSKVKEPLNIISRLIMLVGSFAMFSNSYIIDENYVAPYLLITIIWISIFDTKINNVKKIIGKQIENMNFKFSSQSFEVRIIVLTVLLNILIRVSYYYWHCREEQARYCTMEKKASKTLLCVLTILSFSLFTAVTRMCLRNIGNLVGWSPPIFISRYFPSISIVCCGCYWLLNSLPHKIKPKLFLPWQLQLFPQIVFFTSVLALIILFISPLCIFSTSNKHQFTQGDMIPTLFNKLKNIMMPGQNEDYPVVYGLATVYSATFVNISVFIGLMSAILLGETLAIVTVIMILSLVLLSVIMAIMKLEKSKNIGNLIAVPWWSVLCWSLSSVHFFYATGHQASFPSIHWNSAGIFGDITSTVVPGILVTLNTFISQIIHALLLPMLIIAPFTMIAIWPKLASGNEDLKKGELLIYEFEEIRKQELFSLTSKYILLQAFRVFICMFSACIHSRHLMVWKIFAPKLIFEAIGFIVSLPFLFLGYLFVERISSKIFLLMETLSHAN